MTILRKLSIQNGKLIQEPYLKIHREILTQQIIESYQVSLSEEPVYIKLDQLPKDYKISFSNEQQEVITFSKQGDQFELSRDQIFHSIQGSKSNIRSWKTETILSNNKIEVVLDTSSIEIFIGGGEKTMSMRYFADTPLTQFIYESDDKKKNAEITMSGL